MRAALRNTNAEKIAPTALPPGWPGGAGADVVVAAVAAALVGDGAPNACLTAAACSMVETSRMATLPVVVAVVWVP